MPRYAVNESEGRLLRVAMEFLATQCAFEMTPIESLSCAEFPARNLICAPRVEEARGAHLGRARRIREGEAPAEPNAAQNAARREPRPPDMNKPLS